MFAHVILRGQFAEIIHDFVSFGEQPSAGTPANVGGDQMTQNHDVKCRADLNPALEVDFNLQDFHTEKHCT